MPATIRSFRVHSGGQNFVCIRQALVKLKEEKQREAELAKQDCNLDYEVVEGFESLRINVYDANDGDIFRLGEIYNQQKNNPFK